MATQVELAQKKELILEREVVFVNQVGAAVFEKPRVNMWMILLPILFLHLIYRMQKYKNGRMRFNSEFMITRRRTIDIAVEAVEKHCEPDVDQVVRQSDLNGELAKSYSQWVRVLAEFYMDLLAAKGNSFESLVRSAYGNSSNCLLAFNRLSTAERQFYSALRPRMADTGDAAAIIKTIQDRSHQLRRELAEEIFA